MSTLHRTQIYIPEDQMDLLRHEARRRGETLAAVIREAVRQFFEGPPSLPADQDPITQLVGFIDDRAPRDLAAHHDEYLYGTTRHRPRRSRSRR